MRTSERWAVAVRRVDGSIHTESHPVPQRWASMRDTVLRGPLALVDAMSIGARAIAIALEHGTGVAVSSEQLRATLAPVVAGALVVFVVAPGLLSALWSGVAADVGEAVMRAAMLGVYLAVVRRSEQTRRLFAYHGAEHMAIAAFERLGRVPTLDEAAAESPVHPRCGSSFIALFVIVAGVVYAFVPRLPLWIGGAARVLLVPVVAAIAYEAMRASALRGRSVLGRVVAAPGRALQRITTQRPEPERCEVAIAALTEAVADRSLGS